MYSNIAYAHAAIYAPYFILCVQTTQITMTTGWLLLLLLIVSSQSVDSQSTTDDETCDEGELLGKLQRDIEQLQLQLQTLTNRKSYVVKVIRPPGSDSWPSRPYEMLRYVSILFFYM